ncbi:MAG TPA: flagellar hook-associated protein FlgK [Eoetvoesiella sp.]
MNLANLGLSGINAAQHRLQTTGHNINNAATDGYNRQSVLVSTAGAQSTGSGFIGMGVQTDSIQRAYNNFIARQLVSSQSGGAAMVSYGNEIAQINNLFADRTVGISPALQKFFDGIQAVASAPADPAARQELLGRASSLAGQINDANAFLNDQRRNINTQIATTVTQINSYAERIHDMNHQITVAKASGSGQPPNDLLDQRDQLVTEISQLVGVTVLEQDGNINLTLGNGQVLLGGDTVFPLQAIPSADDPERLVVAYTALTGPGRTTAFELNENSIKGGSLGGLIRYRKEALDTVQNDLGRMAAGLALSVNAQHVQGVDLSGAFGGEFFNLGNPKAIAADGNASNLTASFSPTAAKDLTALDYKIEFTSGKFTVTSIPNGTQVFSGTQSDLDDLEPSGDIGIGVTLAFSGTPAEGDSWLLQPTRNAAADLSVTITDPAKIAAADKDGGSANGGNALVLAKLQTDKLLGGGSMSLNESFSKIVNNVGVLTQQNGTAAKAQATLIQQNYAAQQAVSGVNLNEEYVNLDRYQEQFRAASRLIDVSSTLFDTLLGLRS